MTCPTGFYCYSGSVDLATVVAALVAIIAIIFAALIVLAWLDR